MKEKILNAAKEILKSSPYAEISFMDIYIYGDECQSRDITVCGLNGSYYTFPLDKIDEALDYWWNSGVSDYFK